MNNNGYCSIRNTQKNYFGGRFVGTGPEAGMQLPSLDAIAKAYGVNYRRINSATNLADQLKDAISLDYPLLVEVELKSEEVLSPKVTAIPQPDGSIISMPLEDMAPLLSLEELRQQMDVDLLPLSMTVRQN